MAGNHNQDREAQDLMAGQDSGNKHDHGRHLGHDHGESGASKPAKAHRDDDHAHDDHDHDHAGHSHGGGGHGGHSHHHGHGHGHSHAPASFGAAFAIGTALNLGFVVIEAIYGVISDSVALLADAGHNLSDVLGLVMAWVAMSLSQRQPSARFTYGLRSSSILAALFNGLFLLVAIGGIAWEALRRLGNPPEVAGTTVMIVAAIGVVINAATAMLFMRGQKGDINIRGAYLHMVADAAISAGVVVSGGLILATGWYWLDPAVSLVVSVIIVYGTWGLLKDSVQMSFAAVPAGIDPERVKNHLASRPGVEAVHDLHIWAISTTETALTAHLVMPSGHPGDDALETIAHELQHDFGIGHATMQVETSGAQCKLAPDHVV
ncbi:MAG TPA: cation diffusion facilitator family transporter [Terriglobales bacterium]|nr:cation diffusion facilitator family transporter [Terriglobales bacterium]